MAKLPPTDLTFDEAWVREYCAKHGLPLPKELHGSASPRGRDGTGPAERPGKRSKYGNEKTVVDGITFDSRREAGRYGELKMLLAAGQIRGFVRQQPFPLPGGKRYVADFVVLENDGRYVVEDAKGFRTDEYKSKRRQMKQYLGIEIREV
jgi:hypothetical protein